MEAPETHLQLPKAVEGRHLHLSHFLAVNKLDLHRLSHGRTYRSFDLLYGLTQHHLSVHHVLLCSLGLASDGTCAMLSASTFPLAKSINGYSQQGLGRALR